VLQLECLYDMADRWRSSRCAEGFADGGAIVVTDENIAAAFTAPDLVERMMYGWSVSHCPPVAMAEQSSAALGTALRPGVVRTPTSEVLERAWLDPLLGCDGEYGTGDRDGDGARLELGAAVALARRDLDRNRARSVVGPTGRSRPAPAGDPIRRRRW